MQILKNSPYFNGSFARVFNKYGDAVRNGFFVYEKQYKGGDVVAKYDLDNNGLLEIIVADKRKITIYDQNKNVIRTFYPYGQNYNHGINFSINDFENDGYFEIITGTMRGFSPLVKVFNYKGEEQEQNDYVAEILMTYALPLHVTNDTKKSIEKVIREVDERRFKKLLESVN